jgi:hypothetical protein
MESSVVRAQPISEFRPSAARSTDANSTKLPIGASVVSICDSPAFQGKSERSAGDTNRDGLGAIRGIRAAFFLEGGMGLLIYGIWHLCHLVR